MTARARNEKLRVLFLNDTSRNGGPGRSLHSILKFLDPERIHRTVVLPRPGVIADLLTHDRVVDELLFQPNFIENPFEPWARAMEREDFEAPWPRKGARAVANTGRMTAALYRLTSLARRGRYDLIYCNGTNADFVGGLMAHGSGVPALWHVRYTSLPASVVSLHRWLSSSRPIARILCVSHASAALFPHCDAKVRVLHNALDTNAFSADASAPQLRTELALPADAVVFGSHGRVLRRKGYVEMVYAAERAIAQMTAEERARVHFVVVGDTPADFTPDHVEECRALSRERGLAERFHFLGFRADVRPYVADFDVAIVPSVYPDPLPRSVIESMALGKPVIAFAVGGVAEMLKDGETGALVNGTPPDVEGLAAQMLRYLRNPDLRLQHGRAARTHIEAKYDARAHGAAVQQEIEAIAQRSGR